MILAVLTSIRMTWLNKCMGGLDKAYKIHKSAAIYFLMLSLLHWLMEKVPGWLIAAGVIEHPGELGDDSLFSEVELFLWESGVTIVEYIIYGLFILGGVALTSRIPYKYFRWSHKLFPLICLLFIYHSATVQFKDRWLTTSGGYLLLILLAIGALASVIGLFQIIGFNKRYNSEVAAIKKHNNVVEITLKSEKAINYRPGQYAFLTFSHDKEPHPFTIASSGTDPHQHRFAIKELGDFTQRLFNHVRTQDPVRIEGPYGEFKFDDSRQKQVWIATGIGITPFLSKMEFMIKNKEIHRDILLVYCSRGEIDKQYPSDLSGLCRESGVKLKYINTDNDESITADSFSRISGDIAEASIWFCGVSNLLDIVKTSLKKNNISLERLHFDSFSMR